MMAIITDAVSIGAAAIIDLTKRVVKHPVDLTLLHLHRISELSKDFMSRTLNLIILMPCSNACSIVNKL